VIKFLRLVANAGKKEIETFFLMKQKGKMVNILGAKNVCQNIVNLGTNEYQEKSG